MAKAATTTPTSMFPILNKRGNTEIVTWTETAVTTIQTRMGPRTTTMGTVVLSTLPPPGILVKSDSKTVCGFTSVVMV
jgi:hypothetical protein